MRAVATPLLLGVAGFLATSLAIVARDPGLRSGVAALARPSPAAGGRVR